MQAPSALSADHIAAMDQVRAWTRARFGLAADAPVLVAQLACTVPGCPPLETAVAFWTADERRHQFKLLKPVEEVSREDIGWLIGSLGEHETSGWDCC
jgi:nitrate reductase delta subunit